jgi:hypothetical protein
VTDSSRRDDAGPDPRRELAVVLAAVALGGAGALFGSSRVWLTLSAARPAPFGPLTAQVKGHTEFPALAGLAVVILLAVALVLVTGRWARTVLGLLLIGCAIGVGWCALRGLVAPGTDRMRELLGGAAKVGAAPITVHKQLVWPVVTAVSAVLTVAAGLLVSLRATHWSPGLSSRYAAPAEAATSDDPWRSLDRGEDPTITDR